MFARAKLFVNYVNHVSQTLHSGKGAFRYEWLEEDFVWWYFFRWVEIEISRQSKYGMGFIMMMIIIEFYKWFILKVGSAS